MAKVSDGIRYAERVVAGEVIACEFVRLSCQRFLDDLKHGEERGIYFSEPRAQHILNFYKFVFFVFNHFVFLVFLDKSFYV